jgi:hypothetical protein
MTARFGGRKVESERERKNQKKKFFEDGPPDEVRRGASDRRGPSEKKAHIK